MSIKNNTLINLIGSIVPMAVMFITIPLYLTQLGEARYGVLALVWLVLGYFSILDMGLGKGTANQISKTLDEADAERSEIFWTALLINTTMGLIGASLLWFIGDFLLASTLKIPTDFTREVSAALPWMIATLPLALASSVLIGALEGRNQFLTVNILQVISNTIFQIAPLVFAYTYGPSLEVVIPVAVLSRAAMNIPFLIACRRSVPFNIKPSFSTNRAKALFSYGGWITVTGVLNPVMETFDRFLIGMLLGPKAVAHYTIAYQLATKVRILPASLSRALFPRFSADGMDSLNLPTHSFSILLGIMTPVIVFCIILIGPFLSIWVGPEIAGNTSPIAKIILIGVWANSLAYIPYSYLQATNRAGLVAKLHLAETLPFISILYLSTNKWGILGAAGAWATRTVVDSILLYSASGIAKKVARKTVIPIGLLITAMIISISALDQLDEYLLSAGLTMGLAWWLTKTPIWSIASSIFKSRFSHH